jgi:hypothetical protein
MELRMVSVEGGRVGKTGAEVDGRRFGQGLDLLL